MSQMSPHRTIIVRDYKLDRDTLCMKNNDELKRSTSLHCLARTGLVIAYTIIMIHRFFPHCNRNITCSTFFGIYDHCNHLTCPHTNIVSMSTVRVICMSGPLLLPAHVERDRDTDIVHFVDACCNTCKFLCD